jgi:cytochrome c-type biogenesis protein CcmH
MFWGFSFTLALFAALAIFWPLLRESGKFRIYAISMVLAIPVATLFLYQQSGTPDGIGVSGTPSEQPQTAQGPNSEDQITALTQQLEQRLQKDPGDMQGWLLLGRTYKTMQSYGPAERALARAYEIAPDDPLVLAEFAEAKMFNSQNRVIGEDITEMLEKALLINPDQQKALWLLGFASTQTDNDARAIELWERLLNLMDPSVGARSSVQDQISLAKSRLGVEVAPDWPGLNIQVDLGDSTHEVPAGAVLYVIARNPNAPRPPLGVHRVDNPQFPVQVVMTDANSMMKELPVSSVDELQLLARLSLSGNPVAGDQDPESESVMIKTDNVDVITLELQIQ